MSTGVNVNEELPSKPAFICIAIKPQMISQILPKFSHYGNGQCVFISIAAGVKISSFEAILDQKHQLFAQCQILLLKLVLE